MKFTEITTYCKKFGGAFGGTLPRGRGKHRPYSKYTNGTVGNKLAKKLTVHISNEKLI